MHYYRICNKLEFELVGVVLNMTLASPSLWALRTDIIEKLSPVGEVVCLLVHLIKPA